MHALLLLSIKRFAPRDPLCRIYFADASTNMENEWEYNDNNNEKKKTLHKHEPKTSNDRMENNLLTFVHQHTTVTLEGIPSVLPARVITRRSNCRFETL